MFLARITSFPPSLTKPELLPLRVNMLDSHTPTKQTRLLPRAYPEHFFKKKGRPKRRPIFLPMGGRDRNCPQMNEAKRPTAEAFEAALSAFELLALGDTKLFITRMASW
jgi:hypothetical protein